jgi:hypothetical protein
LKNEANYKVRNDYKLWIAITCHAPPRGAIWKLLLVNSRLKHDTKQKLFNLFFILKYISSLEYVLKTNNILLYNLHGGNISKNYKF